jgi:hypothetical protein
MGLLADGAVRQSFVARWPALLGQLGPVSGSSYPTARRTVKALRAGFAVPRYSALEMCPAIFIAAHESTLDRVVHDLAAQTPMHRTMVVLCGTRRDSQWPVALRDAGARIASLNPIEESQERAFVAEGHPDTVRTLRKLLDQDGRKLVPIGTHTKALYLAAIRMASDLLLPTVAASVECLRAAGFPRAEATEVVQTLGARSLKVYVRAGNKAWNSSTESAHTLQRELESLHAVHPRHAALFADALRHAQEYFQDRRHSVRHIDSGKAERQPARSETNSKPVSTTRPVRAARAGPGRGP